MAKNNKTHGSGHSIEALKGFDDFGKAVNETVGTNIKASWTDTWKQILGISSESSKKDHAKPPEYRKDPKTGEVVLFNRDHAKSSEKSARSEIRAAIEYHGEMAKSSERASHKESRELDQRVDQIMSELQRLVKSSKLLQLEFAEVTVDQGPVKAGEYHLNFLEWMLIVIKNAREKVEDSGAWLNVVKGKRGKKGFAITDMSQHQAGEKTTIQNSAG
jgi:Domain of unknown function (DUF5660)